MESHKTESEVDLDDVEHVKLPKEFYPECWKDDARMTVLFNPFRPKQVNPVNYESKMNFWKNNITKYCDKKGNGSLTISELRCAFERKEQKPHRDCLMVVVGEMMATKLIETREKFMLPPQHTWKGWAVNTFLTRPVSWSINKVRTTVLRSDEQSIIMEYVVCEWVKKSAEQLQNALASNKLFTMDGLLKNLPAVKSLITEEGLELVLQYLVCKQEACIETIRISTGETITIIKIAKPKGRAEINEMDKTLFGLNDLKRFQLQKVEKLERDISEADLSVRKLIRENKTQIARSHLKRKRVLERNLAKCSNILQNIEDNLTTIEEAHSSATIIETYKMASNTIKKIYEDNGVTMEKVDDLMADIKEINDEHEDIQEVISTPQTPLDETSLEKELNDIIENEKENKDQSIEHRLRDLNMSGLADLSTSSAGVASREAVDVPYN